MNPRALLGALDVEHAQSGSALAARCGVTRAAIWKQIEALRALGVSIDARAGAGYRLAVPLDLLDADAIRDALADATRAAFGAIDLHWQIDSTNSELLRRRLTSDQLLACLAEIQTDGRGRRGRGWHLPLTGGLALSVRRRFDSSMGGLAGLSLVVGVALVRALAQLRIDGVGVKWPNDIIVDQRKLAGILIELGGDALGPCHAVIGIGINVRLGAGAAAAIDQPWIDLAQIAGAALPTRNALAAAVLTQLAQALVRFERDGLAVFMNEFALCDVLRGRMLRILGSSGVREGIALGIDGNGRLRVRGDHGEFLVDSGEVSVRAQATSA
ncbi:MAG: biotin--[acetyl-CoA-carboxylase] ligase [Dokdonella sp.]